MFNLDVRTVYLIAGILFLILPLIVWNALLRRPSAQVRYWCGGSLCIGLGIVLTGLRGLISAHLSFPVAPLLMTMGGLAMIQSLRLDLHQPWKTRHWMLGAILVIAVMAVLRQAFPTDLAARAYINLVWAGLLLQIGRLALRIGRNEKSRNALLIGWANGFFAAVFLLRVGTLLTGLGQRETMSSGLDVQLLSMVSIVASVVMHFAYIGLAMDRSLILQIKTADSLARADERSLLHDQMAQLDRQRSLGELSASLGHELNQPLTAILTNAQVARRGLQQARFDSVQLTDFLDKIIGNTRRASGIIERIRDFIRPAALRYEVVDLEQTVRATIELVAAEARINKVAISIEPMACPVQVSGDAIQLSQIIFNMLRNAIEGLADAQQRQVRIAISCADGWAKLEITDTGSGFAADHLGQIGSPFFSTKPGGLGMGFVISRSIAAQHHGTLTIANAVTGGARVVLSLPSLAQQPRSEEAP
jgi:signal transduction histidine kinase